MDINSLSVEVTTDLIKTYIRNRIIAQERLLYLENKLKEVEAVKKPSDQDKLLKKEIPANIDRCNEDIANADTHITNLQVIVKGYAEGKTAKN